MPLTYPLQGAPFEVKSARSVILLLLAWSHYLLGLAVARMTPEGPGGCEFTELVAYHLVIHQNGHMLSSVVNGDRQADHVRQDHGSS